MHTTLALSCALLICSSAAAVTIHIAPDGSGDQPDLAGAVAVAVDGDVIQLAPGVYSGPGNRDVTVDAAVTIRGDVADPHSCVIDCEGSAGDPHRALTFMAADITVEGVTIRNGYAPDGQVRGGAVFVQQGGPSVFADCRFEHNRAERGGAIYLYDATFCDAFRCEFIENEAFDSGAAAYVCIVSTLDLHWCLIRDGLGGGAFGLHYCGIRLYNCTVVGNEGGAFRGQDEGWGGYSLHNTIVARNGGPAFQNNPDLHAFVYCTDIWGNDGGDWNSAPVLGQLGQEGNLQADPLFCGYWQQDYTIDGSSPCAPLTPPNPECDLIGAFPVGCGIVSVEPRSWSSVRGVFR